MSDVPARLTAAQEAAVAKLACCCGQPDGVAVLAAPRGVGKTAVLGHLARSLAAEWSAEVASAAAWAGTAALPDVVLADDAHETDEDSLLRLLRNCRDRRPAARLVMAGEGRLLTLVARDGRIEQAVRLRVSLPAFAVDETRCLLEDRLAAAVGRPVVVAGAALRTVHEITGGSPDAIIRLADLAGVLAAARPGRDLSAADVEAVHGRLSPLAA
jgi:type II secretory pathway predicted ATPase ExeA